MRPLTSFQLLGPLEQQVLNEVWTRGDATARELTDSSDRHAYTTLLTTLNRLWNKGFLARVAEGRRFRYSPALTRSELQKVVAGQVLRDVLDSAGSSYHPVLSHFVELVSQLDPQALDELQQSINDQRGKLQGSSVGPAKG